MFRWDKAHFVELNNRHHMDMRAAAVIAAALALLNIT
tara:strand:+ start:283 stop:393 length:111 start_codon:yes stop_codon:yes gene_type:complete